MSESGDKGSTGVSRRVRVAAVAVPAVLAVVVAGVVGYRLLEQRACIEAGRVDTLSAWMEYLGTHPGGRCAQRARERVRTLEHTRWVRVPAGSFKMGMAGFDLLGSGDETTHDVVLTRSFAMLATELTRGQWASEMGEAPAHSRFTDCGLDCPVEGVNWYDALAFCNALSEREGFSPCYTLSECEGAPGQQLRCREVVFAGLDCDGYRLPTEAEWEYAARAGGNGRFPFGDGCPVPERINFNARRPMPECPAGPASEGPVPVGSLDSGNPWGLWDMSGNVSEWVWDAYGPYPEGEAVDPLGSDKSGARVHRGGSWRRGYYDVRVQARGSAGPAQIMDSVGFRPVRTLP
jgi:formylglycine-generating enzyme required for sulfatase activity